MRQRVATLFVSFSLLAALFVGTPAPAFAAEPAVTYYVAQSGTPAGAPGGGTSCAAPDYVGSTHEVIQTAINAATDGDTIHICAGTYDIGSTLVLFSDNGALTFVGDGARATILDGGATLDEAGDWTSGGVGILNNQDSGYALTVGEMTLKNGHPSEAGRYGGAIRAPDVAIVVFNSVFTGNSSQYGGAIYNGDSGSLTITGSTFSHNSATNSGGAIYAATATVTSSTFTDNDSDYNGGAISAGTATVTASTFTGNDANDGGAIYAATTATITDSTFTGNSTERGGAIYAATTVTITDSTFTGNSATNVGGAIYASIATFTASTFTGNSATNLGGAIYTLTSTTVTSSSFTGNSATSSGGAIYASTVKATSSTFTGNSAGSGGAVYAATATVTASTFTGNSAVVEANDVFAGAYGTVCGDAQSAEAVWDAACPQAAIGTVYYVAASDAVGTGISGGSCDDPGFATQDGYASDDAAIQDAIDTPGPSVVATIYLCPGTYLLEGSLDLGGNPITLQGAGAGSTILDGESNVRILTSSGDIVVSSITFQNAVSAGDGGAIRGTTVTVTASAFNNNHAGNGTPRCGSAGETCGGAIKAETAFITSSSFRGNYAGYNGGAFYAGTATVVNSSFDGNDSYNVGGAFMAGTAFVTNSNFRDNSIAHWAGGAIYAGYGSVTVTGSAFTANTAIGSGGYGGAINAGTATVTDSAFTDNTASRHGGAVYSEGSSTITSSAFVLNDASFNGGAIYARFGSATVPAGSAFSDNSATGGVVRALSGRVCGLSSGDLVGGVAGCDVLNSTDFYVAQSGTPAVTPGDGTSCAAPDYVGTTDVAIQDAIDGAGGGDTVYICSGTYDIGTTLDLQGKVLTLQGAGAGGTILDGGGATQILTSTVLPSDVGPVVAIGLTFHDGYSVTYGGAIIASAVTVTASAFTENTAGTGGAIYTNGTAAITSSTFNKNTTTGNGGAIRASTATVVGSTFTANDAAWGGAIYAESATVTESEFSENSADTAGGAISTSTDVKVAGSSFTGNTAGGYGGAIGGYGDVSITSSDFAGNESSILGGAITTNTTAYLIGSSFTGNSSAGGGTIRADVAVIASGSTFTGNVAGADGGAISTVTATVTGSTFTGNTAASDGGAILTTNATVTESIFTGNTAASDGSDILATSNSGTVCGEVDGVWDAACPQAAIGTVTYVSDEASVGDGSSCESPAYSAAGLLSADLAIQAAINAIPSDTVATIYICAGTYDINTAINLDGKPITLQGAGAGSSNAGTLLDGGDAHQILWSSGDIIVSGIRFQNGFTSSLTGNDSGGAIYADGRVTATASSFIGNSASHHGGAIYTQTAAAVTVTGSTFTSNTAGFGGAIKAFLTDTVTATGSTFTDNTATSSGSAIQQAGVAIVTGNSFLRNGAAPTYRVVLTVVGEGTITSDQAPYLSCNAEASPCEVEYEGSVILSASTDVEWSGDDATCVDNSGCTLASETGIDAGTLIHSRNSFDVRDEYAITATLSGGGGGGGGGTAPTSWWGIEPADGSSTDDLTTLAWPLNFSEVVDGIASEDFGNLGTATGCVFSTDTSGDELTVFVAECSEGTIRPTLYADSVNSVDDDASGPAADVEAEHSITYSTGGGGGGVRDPLPSHSLVVTSPRFGTIATADGFSCAPTDTRCTLVATEGSRMTLSSSVLPGYTFVRWNGCTSISAGTCSVTLNADTTISASYGSRWLARFVGTSSTLRASATATVSAAATALSSIGAGDLITITGYAKTAGAKALARARALRSALRAGGVTAPITIVAAASSGAPAKRAKAVISVVWGVTP
jgi:predicted outer membrane repeat protein